MRRSLWSYTGAMCVLCSTTLLAQQYSPGEYDRDYDSSGDQDITRGYSGQSGQSQQFGQSDWYGQRGYRGGRGYDEGRYGYRGSEDFDRSRDFSLQDQQDQQGQWDTGRQGYGQTWGRDFDRGWMRGERPGFQQFGARDRMGGQQRGVAVMGRLTQEDARVSGVNPNHKLVELQTRTGSSIFVDLGPRREAENLNLAQNQPLFAHGHLVNIDGQRVLMAREVGRVSQVTPIRRPGQDRFSQRQAEQQDIFGYMGESPQDQGQAATQPAGVGDSMRDSQQQRSQDFGQQQSQDLGRQQQRSQGFGQQQQNQGNWGSSGQSGQSQNR